jgi:hypothetical protein
VWAISSHIPMVKRFEMNDRSPLQPLRPPERLEERYGKIGIAAVAAAVRPVEKRGSPPQMSSPKPRKNDDAES